MGRVRVEESWVLALGVFQFSFPKWLHTIEDPLKSGKGDYCNSGAIEMEAFSLLLQKGDIQKVPRGSFSENGVVGQIHLDSKYKNYMLNVRE